MNEGETSNYNWSICLCQVPLTFAEINFWDTGIFVTLDAWSSTTYPVSYPIRALMFYPMCLNKVVLSVARRNTFNDVVQHSVIVKDQ